MKFLRPITSILPIKGWPIRQTTPLDGPQLDAFDRTRVAELETLLDTTFQYDKQPNVWIEDTAGAGAATHVPSESAVDLTVGTASGDRATMTTKRYNRYQPGKSQLVLCSGVIGVAKTGVQQRIGYFDNENGVFFRQSETGPAVVIRSKTTGSVVDTVIPQAAWNLDKMDGTGASKINLDFSKFQIFIIDFQWLGGGRIRYGFNVDGKAVYCHEQLHANLVTTVYMSTAHLPVRFEIENVATAASATTLKQVCAAVSSEGGFDTTAVMFGRSRFVAAALTTGAPKAILTIRPKATFNGQTNRSLVIPTRFVAYCENNTCQIELRLGGNLGGTPVWTSVQADSAVEYSESVEDFTGGRVIASGYSAATRAEADILSGITDVGTKFTNALNVANGLQEQMAIVANPLVSTANGWASLVWREFH